MLWTIGLVYLALAQVMAVVAYVLTRRTADDPRPPARHRRALSILAGLIWPVMLVALVQLGVILAYKKYAGSRHAEECVDAGAAEKIDAPMRHRTQLEETESSPEVTPGPYRYGPPRDKYAE